MNVKFWIYLMISLIITNSVQAKCYWLGYGANYKCYDNFGNISYMFGKKSGNGYYKKNYKTGETSDCKWINGKIDCQQF